MFTAETVPLLQLNVVPVAGLDVAVNVWLVILQFNWTGTLIDTVGEVISWVTTSDAVPGQPFAVSVTVTIYVAAAETVLAAEAGPLLQLKVVPIAGFEVAVNVSLVVVQFN